MSDFEHAAPMPLWHVAEWCDTLASNLMAYHLSSLCMEEQCDTHLVDDEEGKRRDSSIISRPCAFLGEAMMIFV